MQFRNNLLIGTIFVFSISIAASAQCINDNRLEIIEKANQKFGEKKYEDALKLNNKAIEKNPACFMAVWSRATTLLQMGQYAEALTDYKKTAELMALETNSEWKSRIRSEFTAKFNKEIAICYSYLGTQALAKKDFQASVEMNTQALKYLDDPQLISNRALAYAQLNNSNLAIEDFINSANKFTAAKKFNEALEALTAALKLKPDSAKVLHTRSNVYGMQDKITLAFNDATESVKLDGSSVEARQSLALYAEKLLHYDISVNQYVKIIEIEQKNPANKLEGRFEVLARYVALKGDYKTAALAFRKADENSVDGERHIVMAKACEENVKVGFAHATETMPTEAEILADGIAVNDAAKKIDSNKALEAINDLSAIIKRRPNYDNAIFMRGFAYKLLDKMDQAVEDLSLASKLVPWDSRYNYFLAGAISSINTKYRDQNKCIEAATRAIAANDLNQADAYFQRASCYNDKGSYLEAKADYLQAGWIKDPKGTDSSGLASAFFAGENGCKATAFDYGSNYKNAGRYLFEEKKYFCAIYSFELSLAAASGSKEKSYAHFGRAFAYKTLGEKSYTFKLQAVRDLNNAISAGGLYNDTTSSSYYDVGILYFQIADQFSKGNLNKVGFLEMAVPALEKAVELSEDKNRVNRTSYLYTVRINIALTLMDEIVIQKSKNASAAVTQLTTKLNGVVSKINSDYKAIELSPELKSKVSNSLALFNSRYETFRQNK